MMVMSGAAVGGGLVDVRRVEVYVVEVEAPVVSVLVGL